MSCDSGPGCLLKKHYPGNQFVQPKIGTSLQLAVLEAPLAAGYEKMFETLLRKAGISPEAVSRAYVMPFYLGSRSFPQDRHVLDHAYTEHLYPVLTAKPWQRIHLIGEQSLRACTEVSSIHAWRGSPMVIPDIDTEKYIAVPTFSPEELQKSQKLRPVVVNDLQKSLRVPPENYNCYPSLADVRAFTATSFAFDIETSYDVKADGRREVYMVALAADKYHSIVVPFAGKYIDELRRIFLDAKELIGHNCIQFDIPILASHGILTTAEAQVWDTMLMQHLRFPDMPHDLEFVGSQFTSKPAWKHDKQKLEVYAARDVDVTLQCWEALIQELEQARLLDLYLTVQVPLAMICREMTRTGMKVDPTRLLKVQADLLAEMAKLEPKLPPELRSYDEPKRKRRLAPAGTVSEKTGKPLKFVYDEVKERVNPWRKDSVKKALLYDQWGLPVQLHPKTQAPTVDKIALDKLHRKLNSPSSEYYNRERAEIVSALKEISRKDHMLTSFVKEERKETTRIHPEFNVHGTSSGRLSSSGGEAGNFQNQPELARSLYVPSYDDWELAEVDYSNIENRLMAYLADDKERLARYNDPKHNDYKLLASRAFGIPYDEVEKDNDRAAPYGKAKAIVLGTNYGLGAIKTANMYDMELAEVKKLMVAWKKEIARTVAFQGEVSALAKRQGWLATDFGRKRWFYTDDYHTKALSFLPQSTAADIIFRAMIGLYYQRIGWPEEMVRRVVRVYEPLPAPARMILQVHDALLIEYPKSMRERVLQTVKKVMEQPWPELARPTYPKGYAIPVGIAVGPSWGEVKAIKL